MAQDMAQIETHSTDHLNGIGTGQRVGKVYREILDNIDYTKRLILDKPEDVEIIRALMLRPPLHSVVAWIDPCVAKQILRLYNNGNRHIHRASVEYLIQEHIDNNFALTGDTLKFSKERLLDGQYRLTAAVKVNKGFETHMVFGLDEAVFDILDRQRTRTPGDILSISGIKNPYLMAAAVRWCKLIEAGAKGRGHGGLNNRAINKLAEGPYKGINRFVTLAEQIRGAYGVPGSLSAAILYLISKGSSNAVAEQFASEWLAGNRNYTRNKNFDVLSLRMKKVKAENNGNLNGTVLAAMIILTFNHYHANLHASHKGITWLKQYKFPELAFDPLDFRRVRDARKAADTSLPETLDRLLKTLATFRDKDGNIQQSYPTLALKSGIPLRQIGYVMRNLQDRHYVHLSQKHKLETDGTSVPAIWRIREDGDARLKQIA